MTGKRTKRQVDATGPESPRLNVRLKPESLRRFMVHALYAGKAPGRYLEDMIELHCRDVRVQVMRADRSAVEDRPDLADGVSVAGEIAA